MLVFARKFLPILLVPVLILLVLVVHVLLADGAAAAKHDRVEAAYTSSVVMESAGSVATCVDDCHEEAAAGLIACVLALLTGIFVFVSAAAILRIRRLPLPRVSLNPLLSRASWTPELDALSISRT